MAAFKINEDVPGIPPAFSRTVDAEYFEVGSDMITFFRYGDPNFEVFAIKKDRVETLERVEE